MKVYFDVGANDGEWGIEKASKESDCIVYAFEPTPRFIESIKEKTKELPNYVLIGKAVSNKEGTTKFNIADGGGGCSSLLEMKSQQILRRTWPGRTDIVKIAEIEVDCIRMDSFCKGYKIERVDFFHCDTQGHDLDVLDSFGDLINIVEAGEIETAGSGDRAIYVNQTNTVDACRKFCESKGLVIVDIQRNDPLNNEFNVIFKKPDTPDPSFTQSIWL